ncbi:hypothetical protein DM02DRAFT_613036 [Periconia macrospinosa]|uniref:Uncharacterized protein n=1 Tax=Periconia macrospinosa TaxID=97972 RepID=A0A2V1DYD7_9PLEO|nr:hypothetical protein DM02DRAFT_613036 [Periconia macrospinosa]
MPPRIPVRFPWASGYPAVTTNGLNSSLSIRAFSSTTPTLALGPESPNFIEVPKPVQPTWVQEPRLKGHLPIPRDIFKTRSSVPKQSDKFIARATKAPAKAKLPGPYSKDAEYTLYKQRLAEIRRQNLESGVKALYERKSTAERIERDIMKKESRQRIALATAPPRTVDVLTQTSVSKSVRDFLSDGLSNTPSGAVMKARRNAFTRRMRKQDAVRQSRVHDLYTNARKFIVDEQQLDEAIDEAFGTDDKPVRWDLNGRVDPSKTGMSPWQGGNIPEGMREKLQKLDQGVGLAKDRIKKIAETLTGGKL